jgi:hypothetical protein
MGNKQETEQVNHCLDLNNIADEYDDTDSEINILNKLAMILNLLQSKALFIVKNLNKKPKVNLNFLKIS